MVKTNKKIPVTDRLTHPGSPASRVDAVEQLHRSVMACMLWEDQFYEDGVSIGERIAQHVDAIGVDEAGRIAVEAREQMYLRHAPLWIVRAMAKRGGSVVRETLARVIKRPDELAEFLALYWKDGRQPLSAQVKRGLAQAFTKFDAYQLAKYNRDETVKLRDVLFLCHAKPKDAEQDALWKKLIDGTLESPDTWEVGLSTGKGKKETWTRLLTEQKLGGLALLRNLRNMMQAEVDETLIRKELARNEFNRVLPFRFVSAAKVVPQFEDAIDEAFLRVTGNAPKIPGKTVVVIDVSSSMYGGAVSRKSDMDRALAACALGAVLRESCENVRVYATAGNDSTRIHQTKIVPARHGMALVDAIYKMCHPLGGGGIFLTPVCAHLAKLERDVNQMVVITDEQDCAGAGKNAPTHANPIGRNSNFLINVSTYKNGIAYGGKWTHINGWSERVVNYIQRSTSNTPVAKGQRQPA